MTITDTTPAHAETPSWKGLNTRSSGLLMHITSLPSPYGIGTMGAEARNFIDFLHAAGQRWWQILPICPTGYGDSPYQSFSTFAGNPYLIDLDDLAADGLLNQTEYAYLDWGSSPLSVDYGLLYRQRFSVLRLACARLRANPPAEFPVFCNQNAFWLEDYALFMALKEVHHGAPWSEWDPSLRERNHLALARARQSLVQDVIFWKCVQFLFFRQWNALKAYASRSGVGFIGDLPIYVSGDSVDVWAQPEQFQLDGARQPIEVAGCPPDGFSADGQLWGNPLFDWDFMESDGFRWWIRRIDYQCRIYDVLRIDHFRGFDSYYAIPHGASTAQKGRWRQGPGLRLFQAVEAALGPRPILAEDLGFLTPSVHRLREDTGFPGMKVLQFAFDSRDGSGSVYLPHSYPRNCVAYVGTHDNDTALGWLEHAAPEDVAYAREYLHLDPAEGAWGLLRAVWASVADTAILQMQDVLCLGSESRMNTPSTVGHNWQWRAAPGFDCPELAARLRRETELYGRLSAASEHP